MGRWQAWNPQDYANFCPFKKFDIITIIPIILGFEGANLNVLVSAPMVQDLLNVK